MEQNKEEYRRRREKARIRRLRRRRRIIRTMLLIVGLLLIVGIIFAKINHKKESFAFDIQLDHDKKYGAFTLAEWEQIKTDAGNGYLILVNKQNAVAKDYEPSDLKAIKYFVEDRTPDARFMRPEAADNFHLMVEDAKAEGIDFAMTTAYRSYSFQEMLFNNNVSTMGESEAVRVSAAPGKSEHQTGLAVDVSCAEVGYDLVDDFGDTDAGKWLYDNCSNYGFILRYTEDNEDITGYVPEAWHYRYVGVTAAKYITENNLTLEEFLEEIGSVINLEELFEEDFR